jgi:GNAT superfamily N-acetyltransferase
MRPRRIWATFYARNAPLKTSVGQDKNHEHVEIRKARLKDVPELAKLAIELLKYHVKLDPDFAPNERAERIYQKFFTRCIHSSTRCLLVAEGNNSIVGYALGETTERPPVYKLRKIGYGETFVRAKFRRQKIAQMFLEELFAWFRNKKIRNLEIDVHAKNEMGRRAWAKYGFQEYLLKLKMKI